MPDSLLTILKVAFLALLWLFFLRVLRAVWAEIREPAAPTVAPAVAAAPAPPRTATTRAPRAPAAAAPGASLKVLLRSPAEGRTGLAASLDVFGSTRALGASEAGVGVGAIRSFGRAALRAGASVASGVAAWSPHLHAGASAAAELGSRWRALAEVVTEVGRGAPALAVGPTVKLAIDGGTAVMAGALFPLAGVAAGPTLAVQVTRAL